MKRLSVHLPSGLPEWGRSRVTAGHRLRWRPRRSSISFAGSNPC